MMPLRTRLNDRLTLSKGWRFQALRSERLPLRHETVVGFGGNLGDISRRTGHLAVYLRRQRGIRLHAVSPLLKNPPFGYLDQDDFINGVMTISTTMQPRRFLRFLLETERKFGRKRSFPNAPRTLDLDLLFFDGRTIDLPDLRVPHPHWHERESVVIPLSYLGMRR